ncbi:MAG TPA: glycoside hydrolase family 125 protein [Acidobacteriaceae bacterium]|nr:glycoside hydrolase family 125 protein [Acidobacteriaceae bacterium]
MKCLSIFLRRLDGFAGRRIRVGFVMLAVVASALVAQGESRHIRLSLGPDDVLPTGNEWISLPDIRASDGALTTFNAVSMQNRGLLQVSGEHGGPVLQPIFSADGKPLPFHNPSWEAIEYWIPEARAAENGIEMTLTWCAPPGSRAAFLRMTATNRRAARASVSMGVQAFWGRISRVTYTPVELRGERTVGAAPWVNSAEVFSYVTNDTRFAWSLVHPGSTAQINMPPTVAVPTVDASKAVELNPGETAEALFVLGVGIEEFSASHNAKALNELLQRNGAETVIEDAAAWCRSRTRTTGQADLDLLMNRNFLFTEFYAWGKTIDTEQFVGVTSRSPRYYVSAAYWDRDAMLWSFPALLDVDPGMAEQALDYALTTQLRNTGTHSRFIDGIVLEDGFQLDEAVAPVIALGAYERKIGDQGFLLEHREAISVLRDRILSRFDPQTGLFSSLQDSQDEFQILPFITYDNALTWRALLDLGELFAKLGDTATADDLRHRAAALHAAILAHCVWSDAPGADGPIFASATDGRKAIFTEIPPGSLMKLATLGFVSEADPVFARTYRWLHSANYQYSYSDKPFGLPGSYRLPFTTSWSVADHLELQAGREQALKILRASNWDGGIITEGVDPTSGKMDQAGRAFATAAGYVAHAICESMCKQK